VNLPGVCVVPAPETKTKWKAGFSPSLDARVEGRFWKAFAAARV